MSNTDLLLLAVIISVVALIVVYFVVKWKQEKARLAAIESHRAE